MADRTPEEAQFPNPQEPAWQRPTPAPKKAQDEHASNVAAMLAATGRLQGNFHATDYDGGDQDQDD